MFNRTLLIVIAVLSSQISAATLEAEDDGVARYDGYQALRILVQSKDDMERIHGLGGLLLDDAEGIGPVDYLLPPESVALLAASGVHFEVLDENIQDDIDAERVRLSRAGRADPRDRGWFDDFKTRDEIVTKLEAMAADRPDLVKLEDIGDSIEGRDIWAIRITGPGEDKPAVLLTGTQHAREWISPMMNMYIADALVYGYDADPAIRSLVDRVEFLIIPIVNPDGYVYSWTDFRMWRKNRRDNPDTDCEGVDPNRNWGYAWGGPGSGPSPCGETYRGPEPFSEPETAAVRDFVIANDRIASHIDYHSYTELILTPWGYTDEPSPDHDTFMELGAAMNAEILAVHGEYYEYGPAYSTIYPASGVFPDWTYGERGAFGFTIELRPANGGGGGFILPPEEIIPNCEENLPAALHLAEWSSTPVKFAFSEPVPEKIAADETLPFALDIRAYTGPMIEAGSETLFYRIGTFGSFAAAPLTYLGDNHYEAILPAAAAGALVQFYFQVLTVDGRAHSSPADAPGAFHEACVIQLYNSWSLDDDPGFDLQGEWAFGEPTGQGGDGPGNPDPASGATGENVLGINLDGNYSTTPAGPFYLTMPAIDCSDLFEVDLRFQRWLNSDYQAHVAATVEASSDGAEWTTIWENGGAKTKETAWARHDYDISSVADGNKGVFIRWGHEVFEGAWAYSGWNIDDIELWAMPPAIAGDLNHDGIVDGFDLATLIATWGDCPPPPEECPADVDGSGSVDVDDLLALLANWS